MDGYESSRRDEADKQRFWEHLVALQDYEHSRCTNPEFREAYALIMAIDSAFTPQNELGYFVPVYYELLQYIAGWNREMLVSGSMGGKVRGPGGEVNHFLARAFNAFIQTLAEGVRKNLLTRFDGKVLYGCLLLPDWFVEKYEAEVRAAEEHLRDMRVQHPETFQPMLVSSDTWEG
jgi:hypothetical protein